MGALDANGRKRGVGNCGYDRGPLFCHVDAIPACHVVDNYIVQRVVEMSTKPNQDTLLSQYQKRCGALHMRRIAVYVTSVIKADQLGKETERNTTYTRVFDLKNVRSE